MFRLVVLSAVLAVAAAAPHATLVHSAPAVTAYHSVAAVPTVVAQKEISYQKSIVEEPTLAHVGNIEKKIPTGHSYQSFTQYHNKQVAEHVYAPAVKQTVVETPVEKTVYHQAAVATPVTTYAAAPIVKAHAAIVEAPAAHVSYVEAAPALSYATGYAAAAPLGVYGGHYGAATYYGAAPAAVYAKY
ncbi:larval/pupal cuticle protein H1C-like [Uranotaenia lowii]|uniref:larval/pupal cuticle protein H1C-like n=1 Tax=Uranotaenia lowii TaxID=190385 RepID=UPI00247B092F|nr:larval/pupal cuticle protein H1C-like [Uranotaenia lowii]